MHSSYYAFYPAVACQVRARLTFGPLGSGRVLSEREYQASRHEHRCEKAQKPYDKTVATPIVLIEQVEPPVPYKARPGAVGYAIYRGSSGCVGIAVQSSSQGPASSSQGPVAGPILESGSQQYKEMRRRNTFDVFLGGRLRLLQ